MDNDVEYNQIRDSEDNMKKTISIILAVILMLSLAAVAYAATAAGDTIVFRTASGSKYHKEGCSSLKGNGIEITLAEAVEKGLEPCTKCNPPTLDPNAPSGNSGTAAAATAAAATAEAPARGGFLGSLNPIVVFVIGMVVGALAITLVRGFILQAQDAAEAAAEEEETEE